MHIWDINCKILAVGFHTEYPTSYLIVKSFTLGFLRQNRKFKKILSFRNAISFTFYLHLEFLVFCTYFADKKSKSNPETWFSNSCFVWIVPKVYPLNLSQIWFVIKLFNLLLSSDIIARRREEAGRSVMVQVKGKQSAQDLYTYCSTAIGHVKGELELVY